MIDSSFFKNAILTVLFIKTIRIKTEGLYVDWSRVPITGSKTALDSA